MVKRIAISTKLRNRRICFRVESWVRAGRLDSAVTLDAHLAGNEILRWRAREITLNEVRKLDDRRGIATVQTVRVRIAAADDCGKHCIET